MDIKIIDIGDIVSNYKETNDIKFVRPFDNNSYFVRLVKPNKFNTYLLPISYDESSGEGALLNPYVDLLISPDIRIDDKLFTLRTLKGDTEVYKARIYPSYKVKSFINDLYDKGEREELSFLIVGNALLSSIYSGVYTIVDSKLVTLINL